MKKIYSILTAIVLILLTACSGSDTYRGDWKATDAIGAHCDISFEAQSFDVTNEMGETTSFGYSQNSVNINNGVETYGINLDDGRHYEINFPIADDESIGVMYDGSGYLLYTICRDEYVDYDDIYALD